MRLTINDFNFEKAIARQGASYTGGRKLWQGITAVR